MIDNLTEPKKMVIVGNPSAGIIQNFGYSAISPLNRNQKRTVLNGKTISDRRLLFSENYSKFWLPRDLSPILIKIDSFKRL